MIITTRTQGSVRFISDSERVITKYLAQQVPQRVSSYEKAVSMQTDTVIPWWLELGLGGTVDRADEVRVVKGSLCHAEEFGLTLGQEKTRGGVKQGKTDPTHISQTKQGLEISKEKSEKGVWRLLQPLIPVIFWLNSE